MHLRSKLVSGVFSVAVCPALPIRGISMLLGNDLAGGKVEPVLEVLDTVPELCEPAVTQPRLFPSCVITRAQAAKLAAESVKQADVDLSDSVLAQTFSKKPVW